LYIIGVLEIDIYTVPQIFSNALNNGNKDHNLINEVMFLMPEFTNEEKYKPILVLDRSSVHKQTMNKARINLKQCVVVVSMIFILLQYLVPCVAALTLFGSTQFLRNRFIEIEVVPNILVNDSIL
jgi:hypothetical protein